jgi:peptide/nickel transport system ATP-binding protein
VTRLDRVREDRLKPFPGSPPSLLNVPQGCAFNPRCTYRNRDGIPCQTVRPELEVSQGRHLVSCHLPAPVRRQAFLTDIKPTL